jgi:geranylgeranyl diphosphate synthase type II
VKQSLPEYLRARTRLVEVALDRWLPPINAGPAPRLHEAMRYSVLAGGKRLRPILLLLVAETCGDCEMRLPSFDEAGATPDEPSLGSVLAGGRTAGILRAACALEVLHTYSLIHDDLPAMDNDDLRRGRPTNHKVFGEALAILAGDALLTLAFEWLARAVAEGVPASWGLAAMYRFAEAVGHSGMVGGQALDMAAENRVITLPELETIHRAKTGALLRVAVEMGGLLAGASEVAIDALRNLGTLLGLLFQITDDILDEVGTAAELGKKPGVDRERGKATYPRAVGHR